jgi:protein-tyrosine phosphatase
MKHVFWLIPGKLAGRAGPDLVPWDVSHLKAGGIDAVLSVNDGGFVEPEDFETHGIDYACIPFSANAPPMPGDLEICLAALPRAHAFVQDAVDSGKTVMIHCTSGKDRTGLVMSYFLMCTRGLTIDEAIREVRSVRPIALSAAGWETFGREILRLLDPKSE